MSSDDLARIIRRAQDGDREARAELVLRFQRPVYAYLARLAPDLAEDACQETFARLFQALPQYEHRDRFQAWLFRMATNALIDATRSRRRAPESLVWEPPAKSAAPPEVVNRNEQIRRVSAALDRLPFDQRQVVVLRTQGDLTFREIAEALGCPLGTVLARMHRALLALRHDVREKRTEP